MNAELWSRLAALDCGFIVQRISKTTFPNDVIRKHSAAKDPALLCDLAGQAFPADLFAASVASLIKNNACWRVRIAKESYVYGQTPESAAKLALRRHEEAQQ